MVRAALERNPLWAPDDARHDVEGARSLDVAAVVEWLRTERWDLADLVARCPVPLHLLLAAGAGSATIEPGRTAITAALRPSGVTECASGHSIHRDRPGVWVGTVMRELARGLA